jgi:hypothetical protein
MRPERSRSQLTATLTATVSDLIGRSLVRLWHLTERRVHVPGRLLLHRRDDVTVGVHRYRDLRMAQDVHHHPGRNTPRQQQRRARVADIVKPDRTHARPGHQPAEHGVQVARLDVPPGRRGEHQPGVRPRLPGIDPLGSLALAVAAAAVCTVPQLIGMGSKASPNAGWLRFQVEKRRSGAWPQGAARRSIYL